MDKEPNPNNLEKIMTEEEFAEGFISGENNFWTTFSDASQKTPEYRSGVKEFLQKNFSNELKELNEKYFNTKSVKDTNAEVGAIMYKMYKALKAAGFKDEKMGIVKKEW
jgi:hypothetical protein